MKKFCTLYFCLGFALTTHWSGCASHSANDADSKQTAQRSARDALYELRIGMEKIEVLELLGSPKKVQNRPNRRRKEEVWTYRLGSIEEHVWVNDGNHDQVIADWRTGETAIRQQSTASVGRYTNPRASKELFLTFLDGRLSVIDRNLGGSVVPGKQ